MSRCEITLVANAGVTLRLGRSLIFIDALHDYKAEGYSTVTPELWEALVDRTPGTGPDLMFFTHCHIDHFSPKLAARALERWPGAKLIAPENFLPGQRVLSGRQESVSVPGVNIRLAPLPHEGKQYANVPHYGCILEHQGLRILVPGDCALCAPELAEFVSDAGPVDVAIVDFPWLTLKRGREFIRQYVRPQVLVVNHIPFAGDDVNGYRTAAERSAPLMEGMDVRLLMEPFQQTVID